MLVEEGGVPWDSKGKGKTPLQITQNSKTKSWLKEWGKRLQKGTELWSCDIFLSWHLQQWLSFQRDTGVAQVRMSSKGVRSPSTQPSLARESPMGGLPTMEDEEDFFKFSSDDCRWGCWGCFRNFFKHIWSGILQAPPPGGWIDRKESFIYTLLTSSHLSKWVRASKFMFSSFKSL